MNPVINRVGFLDRRSFRWIEQKKIQKLWTGLSPSWVNIFSSVEVSEVLLLLKLRQKIRKSDFGIFREWISVIQGCWLRFFIGISLREVWKSTSEELQIRIPHFLPQLQYVLWVRFSPIFDPMLHLGGRSFQSLKFQPAPWTNLLDLV